MADADLDEIRRARLAQLQQQHGSGPGRSGASAGAGAGAGAGQGVSGEQQEQQRQKEAEMRASILLQILEPEAADRLGRIRLVKEARATDVEDRLIMLARTGQLRGKVTEEQLKQLLGAVAENQRDREGAGNIVISRRKGGWDDDDDDLDGL